MLILIKKVLIFILSKIKILKYFFTHQSISLFSNIDIATTFEDNVKINRNVVLRNSKVGYGTYITNDCSIENAKIGRYCSIGQRVRTIHGVHPTRSFVSTHPCFFSTRKQNGFTYVKKQCFTESKILEEGFSIVIGNDVWIGSDALLLEGVRIGDGAIIGAGSVVVKDVKPYSIVAGNPAKEIRMRFDLSTISKLENIKWWNWSSDFIENNVQFFVNSEIFVEKFSDK